MQPGYDRKVAKWYWEKSQFRRSAVKRELVCTATSRRGCEQSPVRVSDRLVNKCKAGGIRCRRASWRQCRGGGWGARGCHAVCGVLREGPNHRVASKTALGIGRCMSLSHLLKVVSVDSVTLRTCIFIHRIAVPIYSFRAIVPSSVLV